MSVAVVRSLLATSAMLSLEHELLVEMFRQCPALAVELLRVCAGVEPRAGRPELASIDLSQITPTEFRADAVVVVRAPDDNVAVEVLVVEIQRAIDPRKRFVWPVYVTAARESLRCPATLLVIATEHAVARWAAAPIVVGRGVSFSPTVIGLAELPRITDASVARAMPELAVLSALAHPDPEVARVAIDATSELASDHKRLYWDYILAALPTLVRQLVEKEMFENYQYKSEFFRKLDAEARAAGEAEGRAAGEAEGRAAGEAAGRAAGEAAGRAAGEAAGRAAGEAAGRVEGRLDVIRRLIEQRFGALTPETEARLVALDPSSHEIILARILTATSLDALLAV